MRYYIGLGFKVSGYTHLGDYTGIVSISEAFGCWVCHFVWWRGTGGGVWDLLS